MSDKKWFQARNAFFGIPDRERISSPIQFYDKIKNCNHPDAIWTRLILLEIIGIPDLSVILRKLNDPRALCYLGLIENNDNILVKSATLNNPLAIAICARKGLCNYHMVKFAADIGEPLAYHQLGHAFFHGWIDLKFNFRPQQQCHVQLGFINFRIAAKLGLKESECRLSEMLDKHDPERYYWLFKAAKRGNLEKHEEFKNAVDQCFKRDAFGSVAYQLGKSLTGTKYLNTKTKRAKRAIDCFHKWNKWTRNAVDAWTIIAYRLKICRDLRKKIGILIWESRVDGAYLI